MTAILSLEDSITAVIRHINTFCVTGNPVEMSYARHGIREIAANQGDSGAAHALLALTQSVLRMMVNDEDGGDE